MKNKPLVSVVMAVYNAERYLKQSIESILNQSYRNFEFFIINDASTDNSEKIIKNYVNKNKNIYYFKNKKQLGQTMTIKRGINLVRGKYFFKLDNDDLADKDRLKLITEFLENNNDYVVVGSNIKIIDAKNEIIGYRIYPATDQEIRNCLFYKSPFAYPAVGIRLDILKKVFINDNWVSKFKYTDDYLLWYKLLKIGKGANLKEFLLSYRISDSQIKSKKTKEQLIETIKVQDFIFKNEKKVPLLARINHLLLKILLIFPSKFIVFLFKKIEYKSKIKIKK